MKFIGGDALVTYPIIRVALLNPAATHFELTGKSDTEYCDLTEAFNSTYKCNCDSCKYLISLEMEEDADDDASDVAVGVRTVQ